MDNVDQNPKEPRVESTRDPKPNFSYFQSHAESVLLKKTTFKAGLNIGMRMVRTGWDALMPSPSSSDAANGASDESMMGSAYLVEERRPKESLEVCEKYVSEGARLLIISRDPPQQLLHGSPLKPARVIWLTNLPGKDRMNPTAIGLLMGEIKKFVDQSNNRAVVLIDGLEYLVSLNTFNLMLQFVNQLRDLFVTSGAILIMPFDMRTLDEHEQAYMERDFQVMSSSQFAIDDAEPSGHTPHLASSERCGT